jgi:hypothetical protein
MIELSRAQLFARIGDSELALEAVARVRDFLAEAGVHGTPLPMQAVEDELQQPRSSA